MTGEDAVVVIAAAALRASAVALRTIGPSSGRSGRPSRFRRPITALRETGIAKSVESRPASALAESSCVADRSRRACSSFALAQIEPGAVLIGSDGVVLACGLVPAFFLRADYARFGAAVPAKGVTSEGRDSFSVAVFASRGSERGKSPVARISRPVALSPSASFQYGVRAPFGRPAASQRKRACSRRCASSKGECDLVI